MYFTAPVAMPSMVQCEPTVPLAVYTPPAEIVPHFAVHDTGMLAVNCCVAPSGTDADTGVITMGETSVSAAVAVLPSEPLAVTVHVVLG